MRLVRWPYAQVSCCMVAFFRFLLLSAGATVGVWEVMPPAPTVGVSSGVSASAGQVQPGAADAAGMLSVHWCISRHHREPHPGQGGCLLCRGCTSAHREQCGVPFTPVISVIYALPQNIRTLICINSLIISSASGAAESTSCHKYPRLHAFKPIKFSFN